MAAAHAYHYACGQPTNPYSILVLHPLWIPHNAAMLDRAIQHGVSKGVEDGHH
jgi:hypothetical protein